MAKTNSRIGGKTATPSGEGENSNCCPARRELPFRRSGNDEAGLIRIAGPVTANTMRDVLREVRSTHVKEKGFRLLLDFRSAIVLMDEDEWDAWTSEWLRSRADINLGFVTGLEAADAVDRYAFEAMTRGQITLSWTRARDAYAWLRLQ